jgi:hypothetical protein
MPGAGVIFFRADHELIGRVLAEKLRRRLDRNRHDDGFRVLNPQPASASMPSETRRVLIATGHYVTARRAARVPCRNGKVLLVVNSHRPPIEVDEARWNAAEVLR